MTYAIPARDKNLKMGFSGTVDLPFGDIYFRIENHRSFTVATSSGLEVAFYLYFACQYLNLTPTAVV